MLPTKLEKKREIVRKYIRNNPNCTYRNIRKGTKIKIERIYKNMREAYKDAKVNLSKNLTKRNKKEQKRDAINFIQNNPFCSVTEIQNKAKVNVERIFGNIINAYKSAGIEYPKRETKDGVMNPSVIKRCNEFEKRIIKLLESLGKVNPKIRIPSGIVDCLFEYKNKTFVVEIKDFRGKNNITMFELKQLVRYMKDLNCKKGLLICPKESFPKRKNSRNIYIGRLNIKIMSEEDLRGRRISQLA